VADTCLPAQQRREQVSETLAEWIARMADGETIEGVVIGHFNGEADDVRETIPVDARTVVLSWEDAKSHLFYSPPANGDGSINCHPVYAWTKSWVIFIRDYEWAVGAGRIPRNPVAGEPRFEC